MTKDNNINDLIGQLSEGLEPVKKRSPFKAMAVWIALSLVYIASVIGYYGPKMDLTESLMTATFLFEMLLVLGILGFSAMASSFLSFPDERQTGWIRNVALALFSVLLLWILVNIIEEGGDFNVFFIGSCYKGVFVEAIPFVALILLTMRGHSTQPYWLMTMNVFAVSALGWIGLRITCVMYESMIYSFLHYLLPFAILGAALGFFARKIFKW